MVTVPTNDGRTAAASERAGIVTSVRLVEASKTAARLRAGEIRSDTEIESIRAAAIVAHAALDAALKGAKAGVAPTSLAAIVAGIIAAERAECALAGVVADRPERYPADCCIGVNDRFLHSVPSGDPLNDGDVVTVDVAVRLRGWCADVAGCTVIGRGTARTHAMVEGCHEMLRAATSRIAPGVRWSRVAEAMQQIAQDRSLGIVTSLSGHGIGRVLHESPIVPCAVDRQLRDHTDFTLLPGMVLCVEPAVVEHADGVRCVDADGCAVGVELVECDDGWSLRTASGRPGCAVERTVVVTKTGCEVLGETTGEARASRSTTVRSI